MQVTLSPTEWNTILKALSEAPYKIAAPIIEKIIETLNGKQEPPTENVPRETSTPETVTE